jgi:hypothetical protein
VGAFVGLVVFPPAESPLVASYPRGSENVKGRSTGIDHAREIRTVTRPCYYGEALTTDHSLTENALGNAVSDRTGRGQAVPERPLSDRGGLASRPEAARGSRRGFR